MSPKSLELTALVMLDHARVSFDLKKLIKMWYGHTGHTCAYSPVIISLQHNIIIALSEVDTIINKASNSVSVDMMIHLRTLNGHKF